jgi:HmuY protein
VPLPTRFVLSAVLAMTTLAACSSDELQAPPEPLEGSLTVDASTGWAYVSLDDEAAVPVTDPTNDPSWDIAFNATRVMLNGGAAGPGEVDGHCLCQNAGASDQEVVGFTAEGELADFEGVEATDIPGADAFEPDELVPGLRGWYTGTGAAAVPATGTTWLVRLQDGTSFAKLHVLSITAPTADHAGQVTLEYAVQPAADQPFGPVQTVTLDASTATSLDLNTGSTTPAATDWDIALEDFTIRLNGGVSGGGNAAAATTTEPFAAVTTASVDPRAYQQDGFGGVFVSHPWYRYNLTGENIIHPTFEVYLLRRGDSVYKIQLINYYGPAGEPRRITLRYARLAE